MQLKDPFTSKIADTHDNSSKQIKYKGFIYKNNMNNLDNLQKDPNVKMSN